jgi:ribosomal protein L35
MSENAAVKRRFSTTYETKLITKQLQRHHSMPDTSSTITTSTTEQQHQLFIKLQSQIFIQQCVDRLCTSKVLVEQHQRCLRLVLQMFL